MASLDDSDDPLTFTDLVNDPIDALPHPGCDLALTALSSNGAWVFQQTLNPPTATRHAVACRSRWLSVSVIPLTSTIINAPQFRLTLEPLPGNGLHTLSQLMIDKITAVRTDRVADTIGRLDDNAMTRVNRALMLWFGLAA